MKGKIDEGTGTRRPAAPGPGLLLLFLLLCASGLAAAATAQGDDLPWRRPTRYLVLNVIDRVTGTWDVFHLAADYEDKIRHRRAAHRDAPAPVAGESASLRWSRSSVGAAHLSMPFRWAGGATLLAAPPGDDGPGKEGAAVGEGAGEEAGKEATKERSPTPRPTPRQMIVSGRDADGRGVLARLRLETFPTLRIVIEETRRYDRLDPVSVVAAGDHLLVLDARAGEVAIGVIGAIGARNRLPARFQSVLSRSDAPGLGKPLDHMLVLDDGEVRVRRFPPDGIAASLHRGTRIHQVEGVWRAEPLAPVRWPTTTTIRNGESLPVVGPLDIQGEPGPFVIENVRTGASIGGGVIDGSGRGSFVPKTPFIAGHIHSLTAKDRRYVFFPTVRHGEPCGSASLKLARGTLDCSSFRIGQPRASSLVRLESLEKKGQACLLALSINVRGRSGADPVVADDGGRTVLDPLGLVFRKVSLGALRPTRTVGVAITLPDSAREEMVGLLPLFQFVALDGRGELVFSDVFGSHLLGADPYDYWRGRRDPDPAPRIWARMTAREKEVAYAAATDWVGEIAAERGGGAIGASRPVAEVIADLRRRLGDHERSLER